MYYYQNLIVYRLDKNNFPIYRIKHFYASYNEEDNIFSVIFLADIEGRLLHFGKNNNTFFIHMITESNNKNDSRLIICPTGTPLKKMKNYNIKCSFKYNYTKTVSNAYILPYYGVYHFDNPFNIILEKQMKNETLPTESFSTYRKSSIILVIFLFNFLIYLDS